MNVKKWILNLALVLVALFGFYSVAAGDHDFAEGGQANARTNPAPLDQQPIKDFQTATFGLG